LPGLLKTHRASLFAAAPGVFRKMLQDHDRLDLPALRHGLSAGEKLSRGLRAAWTKATGTGLYEAYGMSECSTFISSSPSHPARGEALGQPQPGRRIAILGGDGQPVPQGEPGTIAIHQTDPGLMLGYLNAPDEMPARMRGPWFLTGDQGAMAVDGQVSYLGRDDDMMNAGGYRVSPLEVEAALAAHPGIDQVGVAEVMVKADAGIIVAFYTGPKALDAAGLAAFAAERLARYKQPRAYVHLPALPTGANGKLLRRALPAQFEAKRP
jgi:acyl-coenzyme A synthetase/AMP-(fatty) acid ligase